MFILGFEVLGFLTMNISLTTIDDPSIMTREAASWKSRTFVSISLLCQLSPGLQKECLGENKSEILKGLFVT